MVKNDFDAVAVTTAFLNAHGFLHPEIGIILGTGLADFAKEIAVEKEIPYAQVPHFPLSTVESHSGKLIYGTLGAKKVIALQGRFHFYEGYTMQQIVFPVRVLKMLGIKVLLLSNASGAMNPHYKKGDLMLIDDHINLQGAHPLIGTNDPRFGTRFPDMGAPYNKALNEKLKAIALQNNIVLHEGVYAAVTGPALETRAEYRYLWNMGADAVGMSTVPEVIAANHLNLPCAAVSVLTDECDPDHLMPVKIEDIIAVANEAEKKLTLLFTRLIQSL